MTSVGLVLVFLVTAAAVCSNALPLRERFMWIPDGQGQLHLVDLLQENPNPEPFLGDADVKLNLYTRNNPNSPQIITPTNVPSVFNAANPTRIIIHGWNSAASAMDHFREAYMSVSTSTFNVILVDWSGKASDLYPTAKNTAIDVGEYVASAVNALVSKGMSLSNLYIIGHSLGAHASGVAGNRLGGGVARVVGMDPAAPLFGSETLANRLDASDGQFVEAIHTNGGLLGWLDPLASADFFPNGGTAQAGCGVDVTGACAHGRSHEYYAESITGNSFTARKCSSYKDYLYTDGECSGGATAFMGEWTPTTTAGTYYLITNDSPPYAKG